MSIDVDDSDDRPFRFRTGPAFDRAQGPAPFEILTGPWFAQLMDEAIHQLGPDEFLTFVIGRFNRERNVAELIEEEQLWVRSRASGSQVALELWPTEGSAHRAGRDR